MWSLFGRGLWEVSRAGQLGHGLCLRRDARLRLCAIEGNALDGENLRPDDLIWSASPGVPTT